MLISFVIRFDVIGITFAQSGSLSAPLTARLVVFSADDFSSLAASGCPGWILTALATVTSQWRAWTSHDPTTGSLPCHSPADMVSVTLNQITRFDMVSWIDKAISTSCTPFPIPRDTVEQLCVVWKLSAVIYTSYVLKQLTGHAASTDVLVMQLILAIKRLEPDRNIMRFQLWPLFIAGAGCTIPQHRDWVLGALDTMWHGNLFSNSKRAARALTALWARVDSSENQTCPPETGNCTWMNELSSMDMFWLLL